MALEISPQQTRIGWIGTGVMGRSMCGHLLSAGYKITVFNRTKSKASELLERGARWADSPRDVAAASDVLISIVGFPEDVRSVLLADDGALREAMRGSFAEARAGIGLWLAAPSRSREDFAVDTDLWRASSPAPSDLAMAAGQGGQRLYIAPSQGLVVVRQARSLNGSSWSDAQFLSMIWRDL